MHLFFGKNLKTRDRGKVLTFLTRTDRKFAIIDELIKKAAKKF